MVKYKIYHTVKTGKEVIHRGNDFKLIATKNVPSMNN